MAADSLTPFLGLTKPVVGDPDGEDQWGQKWNANADILDAFASSSGTLNEAPQDGKTYGRGTPLAWQEVPDKGEFDTLAGLVQANDTAIDGKAPLGPNDGNIYGWKGTGWFDITTSLTVSWDAITGKPTTFPPTLPIPSAGVTGLDTKQASQDAAIAAINWNSLSGKPTTFPPTLPIAISGVTNLQSSLDGKEPAVAPGDPALFWAGDKTWKAASGGGGGSVAWADITGKPTTFPPTLPIASSGVTGLDAKQTSQDTAINGKEPAIATGDPTMFWAGDKTWKAVPAGGGIVVSDTPPATGQQWFESDTGAHWLRYTDDDGEQWLQLNGAIAQPAGGSGGGSVPAPPADALAEYVMFNGAWREKSRSLDVAGLANVDMPVPPTARAARISCSIKVSTSGAYIGVRWSTDGTTFPSTSGDYTIGGFYHQSGSLGYGSQAISNMPHWQMTYGVDNITVPHIIDLLMNVQKTSGVSFSGQWRGSAVSNVANTGDVQYQWFGNSNYAWSGNQIAKIRFFVPVGTMAFGVINAEWIY